jgi:hypothetical protein
VLFVVVDFGPSIPFDDSDELVEFDLVPPLFVDELFDEPLDAKPFEEPLLLEPLLTEGVLDLKVELFLDPCELLFEPSELLFDPIELVFFDPSDWFFAPKELFELLRAENWLFEDDRLELFDLDDPDPLDAELLLFEKPLAEPEPWFKEKPLAEPKP